jgi:hypothetical protein
MNNHNNGEPRLDENPFDGSIQRALLHQQNGGANATRQRSIGSEYRVTLDHGTIRLGPECGCDLRNSDGVVTGSAKVYASITPGNAPAKTYAMMNRGQDHEDI